MYKEVDSTQWQYIVHGRHGKGIPSCIGPLVCQARHIWPPSTLNGGKSGSSLARIFRQILPLLAGLFLKTTRHMDEIKGSTSKCIVLPIMICGCH